MVPEEQTDKAKGDKLGNKIHLNGRMPDYGPRNVYRSNSVEEAYIQMIKWLNKVKSFFSPSSEVLLEQMEKQVAF